MPNRSLGCTKHVYLVLRSRHSVVGILSRQRAGKPGNRDSIYITGNRFISSLGVQIIAGAHPASYVMVNVGYLFGVKAAGAWNWPLTHIYCQD